MKQLAEDLQITGAAITRFENGTLSPSSEVVERIARRLSFHKSFFNGESIGSVQAESVSFRSRRAMTASVRDRTVATGELAMLTLSPLFHQRFTMPKLNIHELGEFARNPQGAARHLRSFWKLGVGPIKNMVRVLEVAGVEIYWIHENSTCVDAVSFWHGGKPFIILNSANPSGDRMRFNIAHELGHLALHRYESILDGRQIESEADDFASSFLMPGEQFYHECPSSIVLTNFFPLKKRWGVSIQSMIRRARDLGVIRDWQYERAFKEVGMLGWRLKEPVDIPCEESTLHARVYSHLSDKGIDPASLAAQINLNFEMDLLELTPVAKHYLTSESRALYEESLSKALDVKEPQKKIELKQPTRPKSLVPPRPLGTISPEMMKLRAKFAKGEYHGE